MADFQAELAKLDSLGASVYALTTDPAEKVRETVEKLGLAFPVMYEMDGPETAEALGGFYEERRNLIQPANIILAPPEKKIVSVTYSSGPVGRLEARDAVSHLEFRIDKGMDKK